MKLKQRLAGAMACSLLVSQIATVNVLANTNQYNNTKANTSKAKLEVTLNLDYPMIDAEKVGLKAELLQDNQVIRTLSFDSEETENHIVFEGLELGKYRVRLSGNGYTTYTSDLIELFKTEKHLVVQAGTDTISLGDVNGNGVIDDKDLEALEHVLGTDKASYDLNGDGKVDIEDLAQLYWSKQSTGAETLYSTKMILSQVLNTSDMEKQLKEANDNIAVDGVVESLFDGNEDTTLSFRSKSQEAITEDNPVKIPLTFNEEMKVSQIAITAPVGSAPKSGFVVYEEGGQIVKVPFTSEDTVETYSTKPHAMRAMTNERVVVKINLGNQVPIKKLTIQVNETTEEGGLLAAISKIDFLQEVVETAIDQEKGIIKGFSGKAIDEGAILSWNAAANVTGYKVQYGTEPGVYKETVYTNKNTITIEGLENFTKYYFVVQATNGDWEGPKSNAIEVTPKPQNKPNEPKEVKTAVFDSAVQILFRTGEEATSTNVYYKKASENTYTKVENVASKGFIRGLENDVEYLFYVTAVNGAGESKPSAIVRATPAKDIIVEPKLPTLGRIEAAHVTDIKMLNENNVDMKYYPNGFDPKTLIDGDYTTHWTAKTYQQKRGVRVTFDKSYDMNFVTVVPRLDRDIDRHDGWYKYHEYISYYAITVWETLDSEPRVLFGKTEIPIRQADGARILTFDKTKVQQMEIEIFEWDGAGNSSISEIAFYEYNNIVDKVDALFKDNLHTKLAEGVGLADIESLENELNTLSGTVLWVSEEVLRQELQTAKELATNQSISALGTVIEVNQNLQSSTAHNQNFAAGGLSNLQATGTMAYEKENLVVYVDAPEDGVLPELVFSQYYGDGEWNKGIQLKRGRNVITVPKVVHYNGNRGGSIYVRYNGEEQDTTTIRIVNATPIPTLELINLEDEQGAKAAVKAYILELADYMNKIAHLDDTTSKTEPSNSTEIGTSKVLLSLPAKEIYRGITTGIDGDLEAQVERLYESLMTWEENVQLHYTVLGLSEDAENEKDRFPQSRFNIRYMPMNNGVFMYAAGDHIGIQYNSGAGLVQGDRNAPTGYFGWGINHEIGHIINDSNYVIPEVTNNIFSLFAQTVNGGKSRLETSNVYEKVYDKVTSKNTGLSSDVFVTLGMFWQLHLAYDESNTDVDVDGFYPTLHKISRASNLKGIDTQNAIVRLASDTAKKDLTPFFERWGLHISKETRDYVSKYPKETKALYYLNDDAMRYRLSGGEAMDTSSEVSIHASLVTESKSEDQVVKLEISSDIPSEQLLGYEIYKDGKLIAFTTESIYLDELSANNVTHTYSVVAYDKLLNHTNKFESNEVYIAAEGIISKDSYTTQRTTSGALQVTFENTSEVVGLKFSDGIAHHGNPYIVEVSEDGENWTVAKESKFKEGMYTIYFNKPGTTEEDHRIWTYDAKYIRITGKDIEDITEAQIDVLEYPGDAVYFTENAIGYLGSDYVFEGGKIEKGTLVVMGSYRGHPVYSKIVLSANYVNEKDFDANERPGYNNTTSISAVDGELYMFSELPEDHEISKVDSGIWMFVPKNQTLPSQIKANMFRVDDIASMQGGRLVSDTKWLLVPSTEDMPIIDLS